MTAELSTGRAGETSGALSLEDAKRGKGKEKPFPLPARLFERGAGSAGSAANQEGEKIPLKNVGEEKHKTNPFK